MKRALILTSVAGLLLGACAGESTGYRDVSSPCHALAMDLPPGTCLQSR